MAVETKGQMTFFPFRVAMYVNSVLKNAACDRTSQQQQQADNTKSFNYNLCYFLTMRSHTREKVRPMLIDYYFSRLRTLC